METPYVTFVSSESEAEYFIEESHLWLFDYAISAFKKIWFDEYADYKFTAKQWNKILKIADKIMSYDSFDDLYDYLVGMNIVIRDTNIFQWKFNQSGIDLWKNREFLKTQLKDVKEWTKLVLPGDGYMKIIGF